MAPWRFPSISTFIEAHLVSHILEFHSTVGQVCWNFTSVSSCRLRRWLYIFALFWFDSTLRKTRRSSMAAAPWMKHTEKLFTRESPPGDCAIVRVKSRSKVAQGESYFSGIWWTFNSFFRIYTPFIWHRHFRFFHTMVYKIGSGSSAACDKNIMLFMASSGTRKFTTECLSLENKSHDTVILSKTQIQHHFNTSSHVLFDKRWLWGCHFCLLSRMKACVQPWRLPSAVEFIMPFSSTLYIILLLYIIMMMIIITN